MRAVTLRLQKSEDLLLSFGLRGGLFVCTGFQFSARIPHPALRATLPPGEGIGFAIDYGPFLLEGAVIYP